METWWDDSHDWRAAVVTTSSSEAQWSKERQWSDSVFQGVLWLWCTLGPWWWVRTKGKDSQAEIPVGACYGPYNTGEEAEELFCKCLADVSPLTGILLVRDLDLPDICWKLTGKGRGFLESVEENFLTQLVRKSTLGGDPLDLLFTNREGLLGDEVVRGCFGPSNNEMAIFDSQWKKEGDQQNFCLRLLRAEFGLFRALVWRVSWETVINKKGVWEGWICLKKEILKVQEQATSM